MSGLRWGKPGDPFEKMSKAFKTIKAPQGLEETSHRLGALVSERIRSISSLVKSPEALLFVITTGILVFNYYDMQLHYWFLQIVDGYVVKAWIFPVLLLLYLAAAKLRPASLASQFRGLKIPASLPGSLHPVRLHLAGWNEDPYHAVKYGLIMFGPVLIYLASLVVLDSNAKIERILHALFWTGVLLSALVFYMYEIRASRPGSASRLP